MLEVKTKEQGEIVGECQAGRAMHWHSSSSCPGCCIPLLDADFSAASMPSGWGLPMFLPEEIFSCHCLRLNAMAGLSHHHPTAVLCVHPTHGCGHWGCLPSLELFTALGFAIACLHVVSQGRSLV